MDVNPTAASVMRPGKSGQSVGHLAKSAVAEARANGIAAPKNAQGVAASAIARGADPAAVFAARVETDPTVADPAAMDETVPTGPGAPAEGPVPTEPSVPSPDEQDGSASTVAAAAGYSVARDVVGDSASTGDQTALQLLQV